MDFVVGIFIRVEWMDENMRASALFPFIFCSSSSLSMNLIFSFLSTPRNVRKPKKKNNKTISNAQTSSI
jgi:hypothetical protein